MRFGPSILATARRAALDLEALLLPAVCLGCERPLLPANEHRVICDGCRGQLRAPAPPLCSRCGQPLDRWETAGGSCGFCREWPAELVWARSAAWLEQGPARQLVHALKYDGWRVAAEPMAAALVRSCGARLRETDLLVPVPLGRRRLRERGHNQAGVLSERLGALCGLPVAEEALVRSRETRTQTALTPRQRRANVAGAFAPGPHCIAGARAVLVDDVLTTGATLAAAAQVLAGAGAAGVGALTFARAAVPGL